MFGMQQGQLRASKALGKAFETLDAFNLYLMHSRYLATPWTRYVRALHISVTYGYASRRPIYKGTLIQIPRTGTYKVDAGGEYLLRGLKASRMSRLTYQYQDI
jgi:hypothetical protein